MKGTRCGCSTTSRRDRSTTSSTFAIATASTSSSTRFSTGRWSTSSSTSATSCTTSPQRSACGSSSSSRCRRSSRTCAAPRSSSSTATASASACSSRRPPRCTATTARSDALVETDRRIYGPTTQKRWAYADSKAMDEFLALAHHAEHDLDCVIVRLFNTVGPRQSGQYGMVIPSFVQRAFANETLEIHGDGEQTRCFCHVSDTIRALAGLMDDGDVRRDLQRRLGRAHLDQRARAPRGRSHRVLLRASPTSPTRTSTGSGSRTCSTAFRRPRRSAHRSVGSLVERSTTSSPTSSRSSETGPKAAV